MGDAFNKEYETPRVLTYVAIGVLILTFVVYAIIGAARLHYGLSPHDWDCSRHGGAVQAPGQSYIICQDGYKL